MRSKQSAKQLRGVERGERLHHSVAHDLGLAIVSGEYGPGDTLEGEVSASERLGVSRTALREAMKTLAAKGLIVSRPKSGTKVCSRDKWNFFDPDVLAWMLQGVPSEATLRHLHELRMAIEPTVAELAATHRSNYQLKVMATALNDMLSQEPDSVEGELADERFHAAILDASDNEFLRQLGDVIAISVRYIAAYKRERHVERDPRPSHAKLYEAIARRDAGGARNAMTYILTSGHDDIIENAQPKVSARA